ncbi:MAG TPA: LysR substrate-binding domain-containing protein [Xanthobacteraceae bacterium]|jgi:DNA-binding transcriptional LysR family regulator|nr:LysR substrate-binding domain-containing protein [Xanthobacteraceae bacterium]
MRATQFAQLSAFVAVAEHRNFTKAATHLGLSPPSLSQTVRALETRLGVRLLNRTTRSVALTTAGERLLAHMQPLLQGIDKAVEAVNQFRDTPMGCLRLTASRFAAVMIVGPLIGAFLTEYPDIRVELFVDDSQSDIVSGHFDAGVRWGERIDKDMIAVRMGGGFRMIPVASPAYLARNPPPRTPKDLRTHRCIHYRHTWNGAIHRWMFEKDGEQIEMAVEGALIVNDMDLALGAARDGLGIAYVPEATARLSIEDGRLVPLLEDWCRFELDFFLYYSSRRQMPPPLQTLIAFIRKHAHGGANAKTASLGRPHEHDRDAATA